MDGGGRREKKETFIAEGLEVVGLGWGLGPLSRGGVEKVVTWRLEFGRSEEAREAEEFFFAQREEQEEDMDLFFVYVALLFANSA